MSLEIFGTGSNDMTARVISFDPGVPRSWLAWGRMYQSRLRRFPYIISGRQQDKVITEQRVEPIAKHCGGWGGHVAQQTYLQTLAWVFEELWALVGNKAAGQPCVARVRKAKTATVETGQVRRAHRTKTRLRPRQSEAFELLCSWSLGRLAS